MTDLGPSSTALELAAALRRRELSATELSHAEDDELERVVRGKASVVPLELRARVAKRGFDRAFGERRKLAHRLPDRRQTEKVPGADAKHVPTLVAAK